MVTPSLSAEFKRMMVSCWVSQRHQILRVWYHLLLTACLC